eukprot:g11792.t1
MRYVAMNRFKVKLGCEDEFETMWRERESKLDSFSGFEQFMLLKLDTREAEKKEGEEEGESVPSAGYTEFVSHTVWAHQMDFEEWKRSQAFKKSHGGGGGGAKDEGKEGGDGGKPKGMVVKAGGMGKIKDLIVEPPTPMLYNAPIIEPVPPEHQGGLWEFEDEPSYFDGDM